jgi:hypothetical protein
MRFGLRNGAHSFGLPCEIAAASHAVGEHRRESLPGVEPPGVHFADVSDQVGLDPA